MQTKLNETLIDFLPVFHEGNLDFFATEVAPELFKCEARGLIRVVSRFEISFSLLYLPRHKMRLVVHHGSI